MVGILLRLRNASTMPVGTKPKATEKMMYSNVHGTIGTGLVLATYAATGDTGTAIALGGAAAFVSHDALDRLGEKSYGDLTETIMFEAVPLVVFAYMAHMSGMWWLYAVGWIAGNGMDLIDKKLYLSILWPSRFGPSNTFFPCHRRASNIQFTLRQTKLATYLSSIVVVAMTL